MQWRSLFQENVIKGSVLVLIHMHTILAAKVQNQVR